MNITWLHKNVNQNLIVFFSGWGIEPSDMDFLKSENYDVVMLHHFSSDNNPDFNYEDYSEIIGISFSFGVFFSKVTDVKTDENYAFNGTEKPVDNKYGIREIIFKKTLENLNENTYRQFISNMFDNELQRKRFLKDRESPEIIKLRQELVFIENCELQKIDRNFNKVFISGNDRIIHAKNQERFWSQTKTEFIDTGHFPFYLYSSWDEVVEICRK